MKHLSTASLLGLILTAVLTTVQADQRVTGSQRTNPSRRRSQSVKA